MAVVGSSYLYHMRRDPVENITAGTVQHMAENALALICYLTPHPTSIFFTTLDTFFMYGEQAAKVMYFVLTVGSFALVSMIKEGARGAR